MLCYLFLFVRGCLHVKLHPRMKLVPEWNHPCLWWNVSYCLHVFVEMKFHPGMKDGWDFILGWKKEKKTCKRFIPGWNFKMNMFFINFWRMYSNMLSKVNVFEHNESMNEWNIRPLYKKSEVPKEKEWRQQVKNQKRKNILFLLFSLWSSEKTEIPFCINILP